MDRAIHVLLATSEQGAGGLDCELLCAPATSRDCKGDGGVLELWAVKGCSQFDSARRRCLSYSSQSFISIQLAHTRPAKGDIEPRLRMMPCSCPWACDRIGNISLRRRYARWTLGNDLATIHGPTFLLLKTQQFGA